ncbi:MAG: universal stress protein [Deltaproteobacteria bacterium]|nr:universal stress protein [Deltaproteobacteria bacterium]
MIQNILIPTDGSDYGKTAIAYGIYIARKLDAQLIGLHVVDIRIIRGPVFTDISGSVGLPPYQEFLPAIESGLEAKADAILHDFREQCEAAGIHPETMKVTGVIDETIIEAGQKYCDWILLAQRGEHFHIGSGAILGSTAQSVVRRSGKPVLVTPKYFREIESTAVAYDGSAPAHKALKLAAELSERTAWPLSVVIITSDPSLGEKTSKQAEEFLASFKIDSATRIIPGKEDKELLKFIREGTVELLIMGAYGHNRFRELLVGSTTSSVIRKSPIPVLLTR